MRYKRYQILRPLSTHWSKVSCEDYECDDWRFGWVTKIDEATVIGRQQAGYIRQHRKTEFKESRQGALSVFTFPPGMRCFKSGDHKKFLDREPFYIVKDRGHSRQHDNALNWVEDFGSHQNMLAKAQR